LARSPPNGADIARQTNQQQDSMPAIEQNALIAELRRRRIG
jgi:hypothetical protein